jgi:aminoglycoside 6'-N-acetyltransferase I
MKTRRPSQRSRLVVRPATRADAAELARMLEALNPQDDFDRLAEVHRWRTGAFVLDRGGGRMGGFIHVGTRSYAEGATESPVAFVEEWFVDRDLRRSGQGRALMRAAERWASQRGHRQLASDTPLHNRRSQRAHGRLGFRVAEKLVSFIKELR